MTRSRRRFKALGACALVFSLMAVWASAAQAEETGGSWTYINSKSELKAFEGALAEPEVGGKVDTTLILHSEALGGTKVLYECKALEATAGSRLKGNGVILGKLTFKECKTFLNGATSTPCEPKEGKFTTNLIKAQMLLHKLESGTIDKILTAEPDTGTTFAVVKSTEACSIGEEVPVGGKFAIQPSNPTTHEAEHLLKEFAPLTHLWIISDTAEHKASILGSGLAFLAGEHKGLKWAGLWREAEPDISGGKWVYLTNAQILKTFEGALVEPEISGKIEAGTVLILHSQVLGGTSILYECKAFTVTEGKLKAGGTALGSLQFKECETFLAGVLSKNCNPVGGLITTNKIKGVMLLHKLASNGVIDKILTVEPDTGTSFTVIKTTEACSLGEETPIGGKIALELTNPATHEVEHLFKVFAPLMHLWIISDTTEHQSSILGSGLAFLAGEHNGLKWAGLWD